MISLNIINSIVPALLIFIISIVGSIFSPFGIGFIIFSIVRHHTNSESMKKTSLVFQIILTCLTFVIGFLISLLFIIKGSPVYAYGSEAWIFMLSVLFGICLMCLVFVGIIIWESKAMGKK